MENDDTHIQLACFSLGDRLCAVDIMRIREILHPVQLSALPRKFDLLDGVINLRGTVIPVMNLRKRFGMNLDTDMPAGKLLIVALAGGLLALMVDDVLEVITVSAEEIKAPALAMAGAGMEFYLGVCLSQERIIMILNIDALLLPHGAASDGFSLATEPFPLTTAVRSGGGLP